MGRRASAVAGAAGCARTSGSPGTWRVTGYEWSRHAELSELGRMLALGVALSVLFALARGGWWLARRSLRPVAVLTEAAGRMADDGARLGGRLPSEFETRDELTGPSGDIQRVAGKAGGVGRARAAVHVERGARALDAARATLRSEAEVALRREREPAAYRETLGRVVEGRGRDDGDGPGPLAARAGRSHCRGRRTRGSTSASWSTSGPSGCGERPRRRDSRSRSTSHRTCDWRPKRRRWRRSWTTSSGTAVKVHAAGRARRGPAGPHRRDGPPGGRGHRTGVRRGHVRAALRPLFPGRHARSPGRAGERARARHRQGCRRGIRRLRRCTSPGPGRGATFWADLPCLG